MPMIESRWKSRAGEIGSFRAALQLLVLALLCAVLASCAVNPVTGKDELMLVSEQEEIQMGQQVYPNALWGAEGGGGEYQDVQLQRYLEGLIINIHKTSHRPNLPVSFAIQNSSIPNAWAIPGHVVMTRGLLAGLDSEGEFVYVMGHEMGHVSARHTARHMTQSMLLGLTLGIAAAAVGDQDYGEALVGLGALGGQLLLLKYNRDDELEADRLGVLYMGRLGYDPRNSLSAHRNLENVSTDYLRAIGQTPGERSFFDDLLSTHPRTQVRLDEIQTLINNTPRTPIAGDGTNRASFQSRTVNIRRTHRIYTEYYDKAVRAFQKNNLVDANNFLSKAIAEDRYQPPFYALAGYVYLKQNKPGDADRYFRAALSLHGNYQPALSGLGMMNYQAKNYGQSVEYLKKAVLLFPGDITSQRILGLSYYRTGNFRAAINPLQSVAQASPKSKTIHGILGQCYESVNDLPSAYEQYKLQVQVATDGDVGRHASTRVQEWKPRFEPQQTKK
jgi:predicted Zn-dependent protease